MKTKAKDLPDLPEGATALIALARVAHREGDRQLEQAAVQKLACEYGISVSFPCCESVAKEMAIGAKERTHG